MVNSINHHFPSVQPIMKRLKTVYNEGGRVSWGWYLFWQPFISQNPWEPCFWFNCMEISEVKGLRQSIIPFYSLVPQSAFSVSISQCQKVTLSAKTLNFPPEGGCCLLLGPRGLWEGFGIWVSNWFLQDLFTQVHLILLAFSTVLCYCCHSSIPQYKYFEALSL